MLLYDSVSDTLYPKALQYVPQMAKKRRYKYGIHLNEAAGQFRVSHNGKKLYLGTEKAGYATAEKKYLDILAREQLDIEPEPEPSTLTVSQLVTLFTKNDQARADRGDLSNATVLSRKKGTEFLSDQMGNQKVADLKGYHFTKLRNAFPSTWNANTARTQISRIKSVFIWAIEQELCPALKFGDLKLPAKSKTRAIRNNESVERSFSADQILALLDVDEPLMRACIYLGINAGYAVADCGRLKASVIKGEWLRDVRGKTGVKRSVWLWPETREALTAADSGKALILMTSTGNSVGGDHQSYASERFRRIKEKAELQTAATFHALRRTFYTVGITSSVPEGIVKHCMGHADGSIGGEHYATSRDDRQIEKLSRYVRCWLFNHADWSELRDMRASLLYSPDESVEEFGWDHSTARKVINKITRKYPELA